MVGGGGDGGGVISRYTSVIEEDIEAEDVAVLKARVGSDMVVEGEIVSG